MTYLVLIFAYLIGSVPFGYILTRLLRNTDIRSHGSGNIGATNVLRVLGWKAALPVFFLDLLKGLASVLLAKAVSDLPAFYLGAGLLAMIGHSFPIFLRFKGGKAVATSIGVLAAVSGWVTLALIAGAGLIVVLTRYVSLGSILGALTVPLLFWLFGFDLYHIFFGVAMALLVTVRHSENIKRLLKGTESKLGQKV
jgi:acyl phosphate:glycerol-3-phosphate acyltransferase